MAGEERGLALHWAQVGFPHHGQLRGRERAWEMLFLCYFLFLFYFFLFSPSCTWEQRFRSQVRVFAGEGRAHPRLPERCPWQSL